MAEGWTSKRREGGLETLSLRQYCLNKVVGVAAAREIDNLRGMRLGVLGLGLREYLQSVCVGILPEDRLIESRPVGGARSLVSAANVIRRR